MEPETVTFCAKADVAMRSINERKMAIFFIS
jgi:hypothetical protein